MSKKQKLGTVAAIFLAILTMLVIYLEHHNVALLQPAGEVADQQKRLIITAILMSLIVVVPVYIMLFSFAWKYREGNKKAKYQPELDGSRLFESIWWGVPLALIIILSVITFRSSRNLDPFKPLNSSVPPMTIQVVALQWKWLFIYPQQNVASVNFVQFPINTPIKFDITSDAPMNSFWIPQLGGQIYAMSGMDTNLNLKASKVGDYHGVSANVSGAGFAGMQFIARASTQASFNSWLNYARQNNTSLTTETYNQLAKPSQNTPVRYYGSTQSDLFDLVIAKYEAPVYFNPETDR
ncbi:ubiquinol oxidase subunit II [Candidatus Saccharibacteria bacterium]|nr:ubiquinol oxidase subunit II [Candidatus Saccharibacteria bacterium]